GTTLPSGTTATCVSGTSQHTIFARDWTSDVCSTALTTYHFKIIAKNVGGTGEAEGEFKTAGGPPTVKAEPASSITQTSATLNATDRKNGAEGEECKLGYGTTLTYGKTATCVPAAGQV